MLDLYIFKFLIHLLATSRLGNDGNGPGYRGTTGRRCDNNYCSRLASVSIIESFNSSALANSLRL